MIGSPERTAPGYPPEAMTTVTAASSRHRSGGRVPSVPVAEASSTAASGVSSRASTTCVSGSPKRALNSTTFSPDDVSASPTYRTPENGVPRRAISAIVGRATRSTTSSTRSAGAHGSGEYAPMPPVLGPSSPSCARLKSCAGTSGTTSMPSDRTNSEISGPSR